METIWKALHTGFRIVCREWWKRNEDGIDCMVIEDTIGAYSRDSLLHSLAKANWLNRGHGNGRRLNAYTQIHPKTKITKITKYHFPSSPFPYEPYMTPM